jgi:hypothetical protein
MATALHQRAAPHGSDPSKADTERALTALVHCATTAGHVVVLEAPDFGLGSTLLRELARRVESVRQPLLVCAESGGGERLAECILAAAGGPTTGNLQLGLWELVVRSAAEARPITLLVDAADTLSPATLATLLELAEHPVSRSSVVLAVRSHASLLDGLRARGASVDLVRISGAEEAERSASWQPDGARLRTIEELLGDGTTPPPVLPPDESLQSGTMDGELQPTSTGEMEPDGVDQEMPPAAQDDVAQSRRPTPSDHEEDEREYDTSGASPTSSPRQQKRVAAGAPGPILPRAILLASAIAALLVVGVVVFEVAVTARMASRWLTSEAPEASKPTRVGADERDSARPALSPPPVSAPGPADANAIPQTDTGASFSDIRAAFAALASEERSEEHGAAIRFLRSNGPHHEVYRLLDELDSRSAGSPSEAVSLLNTRSRLRRALCAEWGGDPLGDATIRLGCPGVTPKRR